MNRSTLNWLVFPIVILGRNLALLAFIFFSGGKSMSPNISMIYLPFPDKGDEYSLSSRQSIKVVVWTTLLYIVPSSVQTPLQL